MDKFVNHITDNPINDVKTNQPHVLETDTNILLHL